MRNLFKIISLGLLVCTLSSTQAVSNREFRADMTFADFEDITNMFKSKYKQVVRTISHEDSPVQILEAEVSDKGTAFFKGLVGAQNTYKIKVKNTSPKTVLAYQITWILKHPFEDYVYHKIKTNSIHVLEPGATQTLKFRRNKHYRDDAYYYIEINKVEFDDGSDYWEAPEIENYGKHTRLEKVKQEIDAMEDDYDLSNPDDIDLDLVREQAKLLNKNEDENLEKDFHNKVELEEITETEEEEVEEEAVQETPKSQASPATIVEEKKQEAIEASSPEPINSELVDENENIEVIEVEVDSPEEEGVEIIEEIVEVDSPEEEDIEVIEEIIEIEVDSPEEEGVEIIEEIIEVDADEYLEMETQVQTQKEEIVEEQAAPVDTLEQETEKLLEESQQTTTVEEDYEDEEDLDEDFDEDEEFMFIDEEDDYFEDDDFDF